VSGWYDQYKEEEEKVLEMMRSAEKKGALHHVPSMAANWERLGGYHKLPYIKSC
jgi:hypothetical protein